MSKESDAQPGQHHVARLLDENDRFCLKDLDEGREIRLVRKRPVWTGGARLSPVTIACARVMLEPNQRVDNRLVEFRLKPAALCLGVCERSRSGTRLYRAQRKPSWPGVCCDCGDVFVAGPVIHYLTPSGCDRLLRPPRCD